MAEAKKVTSTPKVNVAKKETIEKKKFKFDYFINCI